MKDKTYRANVNNKCNEDTICIIPDKSLTVIYKIVCRLYGL